MPTLFPDVTVYLFCALVMAGASLIYATVGFGAGMFSVALLALVLPELAPAVATILILTFFTEAWVLLHVWRQAKYRLLLGLLPTMAIGMWLGTELLVAGNVAWLKRALGLVVLGAGAWFLYDERNRRADVERESSPDASPPRARRGRVGWASLPVGLASGLLTGLFGTGGPPVIILLRGYRLDKGAFRATLLWYFFLMSFFRGGSYLWAGILTWDVTNAALWLLPPSLVGILLGMAAHRRLSERHFAAVVAVLLMLLGLLLMIGVGK
jgi:uncharacterized membrane protein YfcA